MNPQNHRSERMSRLSPVLQAWSKVRRVCDYLIDGPRSILPQPQGTESDTWLKPFVKLTKRLASPLQVSAISVFRVCGGERITADEEIAWIRRVTWDGESDKQHCRERVDVENPSIRVSCFAVTNAQALSLSSAIAALDAALQHIPFSVYPEVLWGSPSAQNADTEPIVQVYPASWSFTIWRRVSFQTIQCSWNEVDESFESLSTVFQDVWSAVETITDGARLVSRDQYEEVYELEIPPEELNKSVEAKKPEQR